MKWFTDMGNDDKIPFILMVILFGVLPALLMLCVTVVIIVKTIYGVPE